MKKKKKKKEKKKADFYSAERGLRGRRTRSKVTRGPEHLLQKEKYK